MPGRYPVQLSNSCFFSFFFCPHIYLVMMFKPAFIRRVIGIGYVALVTFCLRTFCETALIDNLRTSYTAVVVRTQVWVDTYLTSVAHPHSHVANLPPHQVWCCTESDSQGFRPVCKVASCPDTPSSTRFPPPSQSRFGLSLVCFFVFFVLMHFPWFALLIAIFLACFLLG